MDDIKKIYEQGLKCSNQGKTFETLAILDNLFEIDEKGDHIFLAGSYWNIFDYEKGFEALMNIKNIEPLIITYAGIHWDYKKFDYGRALDKLLEVDKEGSYTLLILNRWKNIKGEAVDKLLKYLIHGNRFSKNYIIYNFLYEYKANFNRIKPLAYLFNSPA